MTAADATSVIAQYSHASRSYQTCLMGSGDYAIRTRTSTGVPLIVAMGFATDGDARIYATYLRQLAEQHVASPPEPRRTNALEQALGIEPAATAAPLKALEYEVVVIVAATPTSALPKIGDVQ